MHPGPAIRRAAPADAERIAEIYNEGIRGRRATFETRERTADDIREWFRSPRHPVLVAERGGIVIGFAAASGYRPRECYAGVAEFSVYVAGEARGAGVGDRLMGAFLPALREAGFWKVLSRIFPENRASLALCARHGFREVGVYRRHGRLDGEWKDVVIVECLVDELPGSPGASAEAGAEARIRRVDPASPEARDCVARYFAELDRRFPGGFDPGASLPAAAAELVPPRGALLIATRGGEPVACGAVRRLEGDVGTVKRMWVAAAARGLGLGRRMLEALEAEARGLGLARLRLETHRALPEAISLYCRSGYREVEAFNDDPYADHWFEKRIH